MSVVIETLPRRQINMSRLILPSDGKLLEVENFIGGRFQPCKSYIDSFDPSTDEPFAKIPDSDIEDVNCAVLAAREAFPKYIFFFIHRNVIPSMILRLYM